MCDLINNLFNEIGESQVALNRPPVQPFVNGFQANLARALGKWRVRLDEARDSLIVADDDESVDAKEKERAWLRLDWCEVFLANCQVENPWETVKNCASTGFAWDGSKCWMTSICSRFELQELFPCGEEVGMMTAVHDDLRIKCDQMLMTQGAVTQLERECDRHFVLAKCDYETGEMLWAVEHPMDNPVWMPMFHEGGNKWAAYVVRDQERGPDEAETFAEKCLAALRRQFDQVELAEDGTVVCNRPVITIDDEAEDGDEETEAAEAAEDGDEAEEEVVDEAEEAEEAEEDEERVVGKRKCEERGGDVKKKCTAPQ